MTNINYPPADSFCRRHNSVDRAQQ